jgi:DNA polymerase-3 subunit alpha
MDAEAESKKRNVEGQMGLFDMLEESPMERQPVTLPKIPELSAREKMRMEKEITGLYLSGHPMDDYRAQMKAAGAVPLGQILGAFGEHETGQFQDGQSVTLAGIVSKVKTKTTRNNTLMAYVTLEDDTGTMELLCFSRVLGRYGGCLAEDTAVLVKGKISVRDEKEPQLMVDSAVPLDSVELSVHTQETAPRPKTLYLRLDTMGGRQDQKIRAVLTMFPGETQTVLFYADTRQRVGTRCLLDPLLLEELLERLGQENVVLK